jgi:hypothetical protein
VSTSRSIHVAAVGVAMTATLQQVRAAAAALSTRLVTPVRVGYAATAQPAVG